MAIDRAFLPTDAKIPVLGKFPTDEQYISAKPYHIDYSPFILPDIFLTLLCRPVPWDLISKDCISWVSLPSGFHFYSADMSAENQIARGLCGQIIDSDGCSLGGYYTPQSTATAPVRWHLSQSEILPRLLPPLVLWCLGRVRASHCCQFLTT